MLLGGAVEAPDLDLEGCLASASPRAGDEDPFLFEPCHLAFSGAECRHSNERVLRLFGFLAEEVPATRFASKGECNERLPEGWTGERVVTSREGSRHQERTQLSVLTLSLLSSLAISTQVT